MSHIIASSNNEKKLPISVETKIPKQMSKANVRNDTDILCITSHEKDLVHER